MKIAPANLRATLMWLTDAITVFCNGCISGIGGGTVAGGAYASTSDVMDVSVLTWRGIAGMVVVSLGHGVKTVVVWHHANPIPNPFRRPEPNSGEYTVVESK